MVNLNGTLTHPGAPETTFLNRAFLYGDGLYETLRICKGQILFWEDHARRLTQGMELLGLQPSESGFMAKLFQEIGKTLESNQVTQHGWVRVHLFRSGTGSLKPIENEPHFLMEAYSMKHDPYDFRVLQTVSLSPYQHVPIAYSPLSGLRTASSLPYILATRYAEALQVDDAIMLNTQGFVAETSRSQIFCIRKKHLYTPSLTTGCTDGVMRSHVIRLCDRLKLPLSEKKFKPRFLRNSEELFVVDTLNGIRAIKQIHKKSYAIEQFSMVPFLRKCLFEYVQSLLPES